MSKPKTYEYEGRTFEVKAYSGDEYGAFLFLYVYEVIHTPLTTRKCGQNHITKRRKFMKPLF